MRITTIGLDLAKNIFQVHGVTEDGSIAFNKPLRRARVLPFFAKLEPCLIGIEACSSAHYWGRELTALGHQVKLMPPSYVKPYVKRGKSDAADAEAICEAVTRPTMRFVEIKSAEQQALLSQHRAREVMVGQRTQLSNTTRGLLGEFGVIIPKGLDHIRRFAEDVKRDIYPDLPDVALGVIQSLCQQLLSLNVRIIELGKAIADVAKADGRIKLLQTIPGIGPNNASAIVATIGSAHQFKSGRDLAAWIGLTPLNKSNGGKERLGKISRMGDRYLRQLVVVGMSSRVRMARSHPERVDPWTLSILERKPIRLATVAMANSTAHIIWAVLTKNQPYAPRTAA
ncbi:IS110 family RNA-guided transposase [Hellea balneolensis]|uniref:IS110 family transposase n=1 Tax=Hellea balneolensis TaxID=287478 RepID=UPI0004015D22|nr:IS110 family transposase [Hellea balneolensis]